MTTEMAEMTAERFKEVRVWTTQVLHIVDTNDPLLPDVVPERAPSLCNFRPIWPGEWIADSNLPVCKMCSRIKEVRSRDGQL